jgi:hypothetical protein
MKSLRFIVIHETSTGISALLPGKKQYTPSRLTGRYLGVRIRS